MKLPDPIEALVDKIESTPDVVAVVLGGSRADGSAEAMSDWDIGVYYRGEIDLSPLAAHGEVFPPGAWGRIMNGGGWFQCGGEKVDVLLRDLAVVEHWTQRAIAGEFEVDSLLGYVAGIPTYTLTAELASCRVLRGSIPTVRFPERLKVQAPRIWRFCRDFSISYASGHAERGDVAGAVANTARAAFEEAHAVLTGRGEWVCNEKRLLAAADLSEIQAMFANVPRNSAEMSDWVALVGEHLGAGMAPWSNQRK